MSKLEREFKRKMDDLEDLYSTIVNDPLNGCPGDFIEDYNRKRNALIIEHRSHKGC